MPVHEYIADRSFNSSFKNMLRDYYTYGFKAEEDFPGSSGIFENNYKRLNDLLQDMEWSRKVKTTDGRKITFTTCDSQSMSSNPFQKVYRFCGSGKNSYLSALFHTLAALDNTFQLDDDTMDEDRWEKYCKTIETALLSQGIDKGVVAKLLTCVSEEEVLNEAEQHRLSEKQIALIQETIRNASRYVFLKSSEIARYCSEDMDENPTEARIRELKIQEKQKKELLQCVHDKTLFFSLAKNIGLTDAQIYMVLDTIPASMEGVINSMSLDEKTTRRLKKKCNNRKGLEAEAKACNLSTDLIRRLLNALEDRKERRKKQDKVNKNINNRLKNPRNIGVIQCRQKDIGYTFTQDQIRNFLDAFPSDITRHLKSNGMLLKIEEALESAETEKAGDRNWYLSGLTIERIVEMGKKQNVCFEDHFQHALDFFSKTFLFGEIGMFLLDRLGKDYVSPIRIKYEYYMHSLNDFNAIDLLAAIEKNEWCLIKYKRENIETQILGYPIELRISSITGREYLMYYEPFKKCCSALRLEFIEELHCYRDKKVKQCLAAFYSDEDIDLAIERNLNRSRMLMNYTWGVSTGSLQEKNVENLTDIFQEIFVRIAYKAEEYYILNRLYRESRIGSIIVNEEEGYIDFSVIAVDIDEVIPFIRSYYSRVISCSGYSKQGFSIELDVKKMVSQVLNNELEFNDEKIPEIDPWCVDEDVLLRLGNGEKSNEHVKLFNEIFSVYYRVFAAVLGEICYGNKSYSEKELIDLCKNIMNSFSDEFGTETRWDAYKEGKVFYDLLKQGGFLVKRQRGNEEIYRSKYHTKIRVDIYRDILPLSELEIRWLKSIIDDEKIHYFLDENEILALKLALADLAIDVKPFPMNLVNYYDRYKFSVKKEWKESGVLTPILDAIRRRHVIKLTYLSKGKKKPITFECQPIVIEYSKRDDLFVGYFEPCRRKDGLKEWPLSELISVEECDRTFDYVALTENFKKAQKDQLTPLEIEFPDKPKLADCILTEFSPWDKRCEYDAKKQVYHLTINYPKKDGLGMAIRLLGFGPNIRFIDQNHKLSIVVQSRLKDQMEHIQKYPSRGMSKGEKTG